MKIVDLLETEFLTDKDNIIEWMYKSFYKFELSKLTIDSDGLVYNGYLALRTTMTEIAVKFKSINSYFDCNHCILSNLEGCPESVGGYFSCSNTIITSLKFCPKFIEGYMHCNNIKITDPKEYRYALYSEINGKFSSSNVEINEIINTYGGPDNRKYWPHAINLLSKVKL